MPILQHYHPSASKKPFGSVDKALMLELIIDSTEGFAKRPLNGNNRCMALHGILQVIPRTRGVVGKNYPALRPICRVIGLELARIVLLHGKA